MQSIKKILVYTNTVHSLHNETKRAWAEYYETQRKLARQKLFLRLYGTLLLGFLFAMIMSKLS